MAKVTVIIPAAGQGKRMGSQINKQFVCLSGLPILLHTLKVFEHSDLIDEIVLVTAPGEEDYCVKELIEANNLKKVKKVVTGGPERQQSVYNGIKAVSDEADIVLIHDGARPLVDGQIINRVIAGAKEYGATTCGVPVKDTIKQVNKDGIVMSTLDRSSLWSIQTPQGFKKKVLVDAHQQALDDKFLGTDDAMLVEHTGGRVKMVLGSYENLKVTTPEDMAIAEEILARRNG